jgi:hypothetical protein
MSVSVSEQLQAQAAGQIALDPTVTDRLRAAYTDRMTAEDLLDEFDEWAKSQLSEGKPH